MAAGVQEQTTNSTYRARMMVMHDYGLTCLAATVDVVGGHRLALIGDEAQVNVSGRL